MAGGSGTMVGTLIGVFIMSVLKTGLASPWACRPTGRPSITGFVVIGAVLLDQRPQQRGGQRQDPGDRPGGEGCSQVVTIRAQHPVLSD